MLKMILVCPKSTLGTSSGEMSLKSCVSASASLPQSGSEYFSHSQRRCSMVSGFPQRSQFGSGRIRDLCALLLVQIVRLRIWNAVSRVFDFIAGSCSTW